MIIPDYGLCYTFNNRVSQTLPGVGNGLSVLINIDQEDYTETYKRGHHEAGLKFVVNNERDPPLVDTLGLAVPPGFRTYAAIRRTDHINLPKPHGKCKPVEIDDDYRGKKQCLIDCRLDFITGECNCRPLGYSDRGDYPLCSPAKSSDCVKKAIQKYRSSDTPSTCDCPTPCTDATFSTSLSMTVFPSDKISGEYTKTLSKDEKVRGAVNEFDDNNIQSFDPGKNLVYLDIFYDELSVTQFKQVPAMTWSALLGDLGGQMGLFLGMSAITAAEVIEYLVKKIYRLFRGGQSSSNKVIQMVDT